MKKLFTIILLVFAISFSYSQDSKAYLGLGAGYAMPGGDVGEYLKGGIDLQFVNFGYRFNESWGITANLVSSGHLDEDDDDWATGVGYIGVGPMYTFPVGDNMTWDLKPQYAFNLTGKDTYDGEDAGYTARGSGFVLGNSLVFSASKGFTWSVNVDYLSGKFDEVEEDGTTYDWDEDNKFSKFSVGVGVRYNF